MHERHNRTLRSRKKWWMRDETHDECVLVDYVVHVRETA